MLDFCRLLSSVDNNSPARIDANSALRDNSQIQQILLGDVVVIGLQHSQCTSAHEGSTAGDTTTGGHIAVDQDLHAGRDERAIGLLLAQELEGARQAGTEIIHPLVLLGVDLDILIVGHAKLARGEFLRRDVGDCDGGALRAGSDHLDSHDHVNADSSR